MNYPVASRVRFLSGGGFQIERLDQPQPLCGEQSVLIDPAHAEVAKGMELS